MCFLDTDDRAAVWSETRPRARKPHRCCECRRTIPVGERYLRIGSLYDGRWDTYKAHIDCVELSQHIQIELCDQEVWIIGELPQAVGDHTDQYPLLAERYTDICERYAPWEVPR